MKRVAQKIASHLKKISIYLYHSCMIKVPPLTPDNSFSCLQLGNVLCRTGLVAATHHINRINVGELVEELTTAEGELGICLEELLPEETKKRRECKQFQTLAATHKKRSEKQQKEKKSREILSF